METTIYFHCNNADLERAMTALDPFARNLDTGVEENGYEDDMERARR